MRCSQDAPIRDFHTVYPTVLSRAVYPVIVQFPYIQLYYRVCSKTKPEVNGGDRKMKNSLEAWQPADDGGGQWRGARGEGEGALM